MASESGPSLCKSSSDQSPVASKPQTASSTNAPASNGDASQPAASGAPGQSGRDDDETIWAKRRERAAKRLRDIRELNSEPIDRTAKLEPGKLGFKPRQLFSFGLPVKGRRFTVMSWNILAQCLVKRELFPGSDLLKWKDRGPIPMREVVHYSPDIVCLQEVDRLQDHNPSLLDAGYKTRWENGYVDKLHGLLIGWKETVFKKCGEHVALMDDLAFSSEPDGRDGQKGKQRTGLTRVTRNVGLALALHFADDPEKGVIVATHHLFWHARHGHERTRQMGLWLRELRRFRASRPEWQHWPLVIGGDFNVQAYEPCYRLLVGAPLLPRHRSLLEHSRVVHSTVDSANKDANACPFPAPPAAPPTDENETEANAGPSVYSDELASLYADEKTGRPLGLRSVYGSDYGRLHDALKVEVFSGRAPDEGIDESVFDGVVGANEPRWTSVTPLWRCLLDYIFILEAENGPKLTTTALLPMHDTLTMEPGLPRKDVEPSDHLSLLTELEFA